MRTMNHRLALILLLCLSGSAWAYAPEQHECSVRALIDRLDAAPERQRLVALGALRNCTESLTVAGRLEISQQDVDRISANLRRIDRVTQLYTAMILGNIGPGAMSAVPLLKDTVERISAEEQRAAIRPPVSGTLVVYLAIAQISGEPLPSQF